MKKYLWCIAIGFAVITLGEADASNMGFRKTFFLPPGTSWLSIPYLYSPADFGTVGVLDSEDLCRDLGAVSSILRWDEASSQFVSYTCGSASGWFTLQKGGSYAVVNSGFLTLTSILVGAHDNAYTFGIAPDAGSNLTWISVPYHLKIPDNPGTPPGVDAEDLCRSIGSSKVFAVMQWDLVRAAYVSYACGSTLDTPFLFDVGSGYGIINAQGQTISWQPPHY